MEEQQTVIRQQQQTDCTLQESASHHEVVHDDGVQNLSNPLAQLVCLFIVYTIGT